MKPNMKSLVILLMSFALSAPMLSAWGRLGHATIAHIAEKHLTPAAEKALDEYLDALPISAIASDADIYRGTWTMDLGFVPTNPDEARVPWLKSFDFSTPMNIAPYSHMITVDGDFKCYRTDDLNGEYINNIALYVDRLAEELKKNAAGMDPHERYKAIALIVHFVGDMHCPVHIVYRPANALKGKFKVWWNGEQQSLHGIWDNLIFKAYGNWSFGDMALMADTADEEEIACIVAGDIYDYAGDSAKECWPVVNSCSEGDVMPQTYAFDVRPLVLSQLRKAGYRLAAVLNEIF